jgi:hypothetical protein
MTIRELAFEVHYGGRINRGLTCTYVGGDVDVHAKTYDKVKLSFFETEGGRTKNSTRQLHESIVI